MNWSNHILTFYKNLTLPEVSVPRVEVLNPYKVKETQDLMRQFYEKYYSDERERKVLIGINPGRFGAGLTGIPFTDPVYLHEQCGIENRLPKKHELSSKYIYDVVEASGGPEAFFDQVYITSVCPVGFVRDGKNLNYYDDKQLTEELEAYNVKELEKQIQELPVHSTAWILGQGANFKYFKKLNEKHGFFKQVKPLPHPRWVMQYRLKSKQDYISRYLQVFQE